MAIDFGSGPERMRYPFPDRPKRKAVSAEPSGHLPFWRVSPSRTSDPNELVNHGIMCAQRDDGRGQLASGWALWELGDIGRPETFTFLREGYELWQESPGYDPNEGRLFLDETLERLSNDPPAPWPDIWAEPREVVLPIANYYSARCWAVCMLAEVLAPNERAETEPVLFNAITRIRVEFVTPAGMSWANDFANRHG